MTSGVFQDDWREAEGCIGGSTSLPAVAEQASRAAENRSPKARRQRGRSGGPKLHRRRQVGRQGQVLDASDAETPGFHGQGCLTPHLVIQLNIKSFSEELTKRPIDVPHETTF